MTAAEAANAPPGVFVLLEHGPAPGREAPRLHWDLLIDAQNADRVPTWRLAHDPTMRAGDIPAERIGDHRRLYLGYEGPVSGGRGVVKRADCGSCLIRRWSATSVVLELQGARLRGRCEIIGSGPGQCVFRRLDGSSSESYK